MNNRERLKEIILQLKQIQIDRELTVQEIYNMVKDSGGYTSLSTVRRVFEENSEDHNFRYRDSIQPIARALIGIGEYSEPLDAAQADALKNIALYKDSLIQELQADKAALEQKLEEEQRKVAYLLDQIKRQNQMIDRILGG